MTTTAVDNAPKQLKALHFALWGVQALLGLMFLSAGAMKATAPIEALAQQMSWAGDIPASLVRFIGASEFLGGLGLVLPAATRIKPILTPLAGVGLATIMLFAAVFHLSRGEFSALPVNVVLGSLAAFVAWGRFKKAPIAAR